MAKTTTQTQFLKAFLDFISSLALNLLFFVTMAYLMTKIYIPKSIKNQKGKPNKKDLPFLKKRYHTKIMT
jgi:hypothetical protein